MTARREAHQAWIALALTQFANGSATSRRMRNAAPAEAATIAVIASHCSASNRSLKNTAQANAAIAGSRLSSTLKVAPAGGSVRPSPANTAASN